MIDASRKGKRGERRVVNAYKATGFPDANRDASKLEHDGRACGVDVRVTVGPLRLACQVRARIRPNVFDALDDAVDGAQAGEMPLAHVERTRGRFEEPDRVVVLRESDWLDLLISLSGSVPAPAIVARGATGAAPARPDFLIGEHDA